MNRIISLALALALLPLACGEEEGITRPGPEPKGERIEPVTPGAVLWNVKEGFTYRKDRIVNISLGDGFIFYFDPRDVGQKVPYRNYVIPKSWNRDGFMRAVKGLFYAAYSLAFAISTEGLGDPGPEATRHVAENVTLSLHVMFNELEGYLCDQGSSELEFESYISANGKKYWRLKTWRDRTYPQYDDLGVERASFGKILAIYFKYGVPPGPTQR